MHKVVHSRSHDPKYQWLVVNPEGRWVDEYNKEIDAIKRMNQLNNK